MASYVPTLFEQYLATGHVVVGTDAWKIALGTGTVPIANRDGVNQYYGGSDFASEFTGGTNYSAGGASITVTGAIYTTGSVHNYCVSQSSTGYIQWTSATITSVTYAYLYDNSATQKVVACVWDFGGAQSVTANTFQITFSDTTPSYRLWYLSTS
jgi:hypothetical protein